MGVFMMKTSVSVLAFICFVSASTPVLAAAATAEEAQRLTGVFQTYLSTEPGVVAVAPEGEDDARIDLWLMSCRVLGRKVEETILADMVARARALGARRLIGEYSASAKNALVRELYPRLGFTETGRKGASVFYALPLDDVRVGADGQFIELLQSHPQVAEVFVKDGKGGYRPRTASVH